ncbi:MAG: selenium-dependent molybdenum cofactor biosynthesis protein YqeB, partial [Actinomycetia bacterium]|nr:selenium-dependent molybdenum cofactor biosynthesis protein YqeB [Actinomycetes bacterium]
RRVGFPVVVLELERPLTVRRTVAYSTAVTEGRIVIDGIEGKRVRSVAEALDATSHRVVPVLVAPEIPEIQASVVVDARLAKKNLGTSTDQAPFVVALGPGFTAGNDCHAVIETKRGHNLGRVIWDGPAAPNTGIPGVIGGASADRVIHAPLDGDLTWEATFGDVVQEGAVLGSIDREPIRSRIGGTVRGLMLPGAVSQGLKIADIDPRFDPTAVHHISDKSLSVGGGVLEAVLVWLNNAAL